MLSRVRVYMLGAVPWLKQRLERRAKLLQVLFLVVGLTYLLAVLDTTPVTRRPPLAFLAPRFRQNLEVLLLQINNNSHTISAAVSTLVPQQENKELESTQEGVPDLTTLQELPKPLTTPKFSECFKFIHDRSTFRLGGEVVNPVPDEVTYNIQPVEGFLCNASGPFVLATVLSAVPNKASRDKIRQTWAHPKLYNLTQLRAVFVVGQTLDPHQQEDLDKEAQQYRDMLQYNYIDSYRNLTYKTMSLLTWAATHCPFASFVGKIDDDVLVNPIHLRTFLLHQLHHAPKTPQHQQLEEELTGRTISATDCIYGRLENFHQPHRQGRWGLTREEYPERVFPPFMLGPAYIVGRDAVINLVHYAPYTPRVWLEDVYTTGLVAHAAGVPRVSASNVYATSLTQFTKGARVFLTENSEASRTIGWVWITKQYKIKL